MSNDGMTAGGTTTEDPVFALAEDFSQTARSLFAAGSVNDTLSLALTLALETIEGCNYAGIVLFDNDQITRQVHTNELVTALDAIQYLHGEGPSVECIEQDLSIYADDLANDRRWPRFGSEAAALGVRSMLALPLLADNMSGSLNLYACYSQAFGVIDRARGLLLATLAALALAAAQGQEDMDRRELNLQTALVSRELIGQAEGILMERERVTSDQAFDILRRASQHLNRKLREVAQNLVDTGENPDTGYPRPKIRGGSSLPAAGAATSENQGAQDRPQH